MFIVCSNYKKNHFQFRRYVAKSDTAKDITANVKGLSSKVIIANPPPGIVFYNF